MKKLCIFDLDGTLLDTLPTISYYCNLSLREFGLPEIEEEKFKYLAGNGAKVLIERMLDEVGADREEYFDKVYKFYNREYDKNVSYLTKPFDGVPEMLAGLKTLGIDTAVISNKPDFAAVNVVKLFLGELVDIAHGGREGIPLKPAPDGVFEIMEEAGVTADECIYVGDTGTDMETGKNSGIFSIGVLWGFRKEDELLENGADMIVSHPLEILDYAKKCNMN